MANRIADDGRRVNKKGMGGGKQKGGKRKETNGRKRKQTEGAGTKMERKCMEGKGREKKGQRGRIDAVMEAGIGADIGKGSATSLKTMLRSK